MSRHLRPLPAHPPSLTTHTSTQPPFSIPTWQFQIYIEAARPSIFRVLCSTMLLEACSSSVQQVNLTSQTMQFSKPH